MSQIVSPTFKTEGQALESMPLGTHSLEVESSEHYLELLFRGIRLSEYCETYLAVKFSAVVLPIDESSIKHEVMLPH